jgi:hypothetical protein
MVKSASSRVSNHEQYGSSFETREGAAPQDEGNLCELMGHLISKCINYSRP